jgi:xanthine dehydrogenase accessory factor
MAAGDIPPDLGPRTLVAVFASPVATHLLHFATDLGYRAFLLEPKPHLVPDKPSLNFLSTVDNAIIGPDTDIVVTDHDRPELGQVLRETLATNARWIGVMGSVRHIAQHVPALQTLGVADTDIARIHRPIGLNIGSKSPAEIAIATLAGLIADRNGRPGGFAF